MSRRVLHLLSQRPELTGSGITLDAIVRFAQTRSWEQHAVVGVPVGDVPSVGELPPERIHALRFGEGGDLAFPVPGMSDVMPYASTVFSQMDEAQISAYREAWRERLAAVLEAVRPDVIHSHHIWLLSSLVKELAPDIPVVNHCHATGLRQLQLTPSLASEVVKGCSANDRFVALHSGHVEQLCDALNVSEDRVDVVGAGFRDDVFRAPANETARPDRIAFVGKLSRAKGVVELLEAFEAVRRARPGVELHVAGGGSGDEARDIAAKVEATAGVVYHGMLKQFELAPLLQTSKVFVLPSYYEGLPLVLVEALASGCRLISTALPGVVEQIAPYVGSAMRLVDLPRIIPPDRPKEEDLPAFVSRLEAAMHESLDSPSVEKLDLREFTWEAVGERVERIWLELLAS
ncbi:MAG: glycosyltransferase family 4 protein [Planctomycetota bacterium]